MDEPILGIWQGFAHRNNENDEKAIHSLPKEYGAYAFNFDGTGYWASEDKTEIFMTPFLWKPLGDGVYAISYPHGMHWFDAFYNGENDVLTLRLCFGPFAGMIRYLRRQELQ